METIRSLGHQVTGMFSKRQGKMAPLEMFQAFPELKGYIAEPEMSAQERLYWKTMKWREAWATEGTDDASHYDD